MKKWSYATALMLSLAGGGMLTGCIDNDEPYGIEKIRLATASFLESKKAAEEAEAAATTARAEIEKIKAETERINAEKEKILAEAQAEIFKAQAAHEQAKADNIKAQTEAYIAKQKAELDEFIAKAEIRIKNAELKYQDALYQFEETKRKNAGSANSKLYQAWETAFKLYLTQLDQVNDINKQYLHAQQDYAENEIDLVYNKNTGKWESTKYERKEQLTSSIEWLEKQIKLQNEAIAKHQEYIEELNNIKASDLYTLFDKYDALQKENTEALANANVELATIAVENKAVYDSHANLKKQVDEFGNKEIAIPAYTWEPDKALAAIGLTEKMEVVPERVSYTLNDNRNYNTYIGKYEDFIKIYSSYILDANDKAWTAARINEMKRELTETNTALADAQKDWELAKKVYNDGKDVQPADLPGQAAVKAAVDAYNALGAASTSLHDAVVDAKKKAKEAWDVYEKELDKYQGNYGETATGAVKTFFDAKENHNTAINKAYEECNSAETAAEKARNSAYKTADNSWLNIQKDLEVANETVRVLNEAKNNGQTYPDLEKELKAAMEKVTKLEADLATAQTKAAADKNKADEAYNKAYVAAQTKYADAVAAANKAYNEAYNTFVAAGGRYVVNEYGEQIWIDNIDLDPAYEPVKTAWDKYQAAGKVVDDANNAFDKSREGIMNAYKKLGDAIESQLESLPIDYWPLYYVDGSVWDYVYYYNEDTEFPVAVTPIEAKNENAVYENAQFLLIETSNEAYGTLASEPGNGYLPWEENLAKDMAFLLAKDKITVETLNEYIKKDEPYMTQFYYYTVYNRFGLFGKACQLENRIKVAQAYIDNEQLLTEATATLQANRDALEKSKEDALKEQQELNDQLDDVKKQITALEKNVTDKITDLEHWNRVYGWILSDITTNISIVEDKEIPSYQNIDAYIKASVEDVEEQIKGCNNEIEYYTKLLEKAKYQLEQYENGEAVLLPNPAAIRVEYLESKLNREKEYLTFLKNRADELQAQYEAATKQ